MSPRSPPLSWEGVLNVHGLGKLSLLGLIIGSFDGLGYSVLPGFKELESVECYASCFSLIPGYKVKFVMQMPGIKIRTMEEGEGVCC